MRRSRASGEWLPYRSLRQALRTNGDGLSGWRAPRSIPGQGPPRRLHGLARAIRSRAVGRTRDSTEAPSERLTEEHGRRSYPLETVTIADCSGRWPYARTDTTWEARNRKLAAIHLVSLRRPPFRLRRGLSVARRQPTQLRFRPSIPVGRLH
jgi:hypothetical protein